MVNSFMSTVYQEQVHALHYIPMSIFSPPPFCKQLLVDFVVLSSYVQKLHTSILFTPQRPFLTPRPSH
jgi:hypothetical protein